MPTPQEGQQYDVCVGASWTKPGDAATLTELEQLPTDPQESYCTFRYDFQPASVDSSIPGLVTIESSSRRGPSGDGGVQVHVGNSSGVGGGILFKGKEVESKTHNSTDCLLVFDGNAFRLEKCLRSFTQLRPVRRHPASKATNHSWIAATKCNTTTSSHAAATPAPKDTDSAAHSASASPELATTKSRTKRKRVSCDPPVKRAPSNKRKTTASTSTSTSTSASTSETKVSIQTTTTKMTMTPVVGIDAMAGGS